MLTNIGLQRALIEATKVVDERLGKKLEIAMGSDVVEALAIAFINAEVNTELRERVKAAIEGTGDEKNIPANADYLTAGRPATFADITDGPGGGTHVVSRNTETNWKRKILGFKAHFDNTKPVRLHIEESAVNGSHYWELDPGLSMQINCSDETEIWAWSTVADTDMTVWPFGYGIPAEVDIP